LGCLLKDQHDLRELLPADVEVLLAAAAQAEAEAVAG